MHKVCESQGCAADDVAAAASDEAPPVDPHALSDFMQEALTGRPAPQRSAGDASATAPPGPPLDPPVEYAREGAAYAGAAGATAADADGADGVDPSGSGEALLHRPPQEPRGVDEASAESVSPAMLAAAAATATTSALASDLQRAAESLSHAVGVTPSDGTPAEVRFFPSLCLRTCCPAPATATTRCTDSKPAATWPRCLEPCSSAELPGGAT